MLQDASRLHLIPSKHQRPTLYTRNLKSQPVWQLSELQSQNRWTNKQSITGLGQNSAKLKIFQDNFDKIKSELTALAAEDLLTDDEEWFKDTGSVVSASEIILTQLSHNLFYRRRLELSTQKCCFCTGKRNTRLVQKPRLLVRS